jgi:phage repressor protein C with HTH and peptisase S24 domain
VTNPGALYHIALALGTTVETLKRGDASEQAVPPANVSRNNVELLDRDNGPPHREQMRKNVPVYGTVYGGASGDFTMNGEQVDSVRRPPRLEGRTDIIAVYVRGTSMEPRFHEGELVYLETSRPPSIGDDVVVVLRPTGPDPEHPAYLKCLVATTPTRLRLKQYNPPQVIEFDRRKVERIYRVMTMVDLLGV